MCVSAGRTRQRRDAGSRSSLNHVLSAPPPRTNALRLLPPPAGLQKSVSSPGRVAPTTYPTRPPASRHMHPIAHWVAICSVRPLQSSPNHLISSQPHPADGIRRRLRHSARHLPTCPRVRPRVLSVDPHRPRSPHRLAFPVLPPLRVQSARRRPRRKVVPQPCPLGQACPSAVLIGQ